MAFKMKGSSLYGKKSPLKKDKPTYEEAWNKITSGYGDSAPAYVYNVRERKSYPNNEAGKELFINNAKLYNATKPHSFYAHLVQTPLNI